jgi:hypothetical protein
MSHNSGESGRSRPLASARFSHFAPSAQEVSMLAPRLAAASPAVSHQHVYGAPAQYAAAKPTQFRSSTGAASVVTLAGHQPPSMFGVFSVTSAQARGRRGRVQPMMAARDHANGLLKVSQPGSAGGLWHRCRLTRRAGQYGLRLNRRRTRQQTYGSPQFQPRANGRIARYPGWQGLAKPSGRRASARPDTMTR